MELKEDLRKRLGTEFGDIKKDDILAEEALKSEEAVG